jgi:hypothetical protein
LGGRQAIMEAGQCAGKRAMGRWAGKLGGRQAIMGAGQCAGEANRTVGRQIGWQASNHGGGAECG